MTSMMQESQQRSQKAVTMKRISFSQSPCSSQESAVLTRRVRLSVGIVLTAAAALANAQTSSNWVQNLTAPLASAVSAGTAVVPDRYIVVLKSHLTLDRLQDLPISMADIDQTFAAVFPGFSIRLPAHMAELLAQHPLVARVEADQIMQLQGTQTNPPWGLDRIDRAAAVYDARYNYRSAGAGTHVYVLDSGLRRTHSDFTGRVGNGFDAVGNGGLGGGSLIGIGRGSGGSRRGLFGLGGTQNDTTQPAPNDPMDASTTPDDCNGHGTHVAGTVAGTVYGVAKQAIVHAVRVVNCQGVGTSSSAIAGLEWVIKNHVRPAVVNMSLGGGSSDAMDQAVRSATQAGITVVTAAGNDNTDGCASSPGREPMAINVGATERNDARASYSNFGSCVDMFAPGSGVLSAGIRSDSDQTTKSGTSMASPHVAGAVAKLLSEGVAPADIPRVLLGRSTSNVVSDVKGTANRMLFSD